MKEAGKRGFTNLKVITCDMNEFKADKEFDRVVTVEMFEHMRNWEKLFTRIAGWMRPDGLMFMHVFAHKSYPYAFEVTGDSDWMS
jgi:cyclopropane fatty-acyl-phospholipid synthase-like methyltransferase